MRLRLYRSLQAVLHNTSPSVITLGNFDGIHRGHAWLINQVIACAKSHDLRSVMLTFDPLPAEFFSPHKSPARLMRFIEKWKYLQRFDLDELFVLSFNQVLSQMSAIDFIQKILVEKLNVKHIFVGDDFRFGYQRQGDVALLREQGKKWGFTITTHTECCSDVISSTSIRDALKAGDFVLAEQLLGHPYKNIGRVVHGSQLGRELGCPTANIPMRRRASPVHGVYVVKVMTGKGIQHYGVASVGNRPAVGGDPAFLLEVHLFDFSGDLYGKRLEVTYLHKLRDEWMFDSLDALKVQIEKDCQMARECLKLITGRRVEECKSQ